VNAEADLCDMLNLMTVGNGKKKFFEFTEKGPLLRPLQFGVPSQIAGSRFSVANMLGSVEQGYCALAMARQMRSEDQKEKGAFMHAGYMGVNVHSEVSRIVTMVSNISRFIVTNELIIYADDRNETPNVLNTLYALQLLDFTGVVVISDRTIPILIKPSARKLVNRIKNEDDTTRDVETSDQVFEFNNALFSVIIGTPSLYVNKKSYVFSSSVLDTTLDNPMWYPVDPVVFDIRAMGSSQYAKGKFIMLEQALSATLLMRRREWETWGFPVFSRCGLHAGMLSEQKSVSTIKVFSGCDPHNLVMWVTKGIDPTKEKNTFGVVWFYEVDSLKVVTEVVIQSVVANVSRCVRSLTLKLPYMAMHELGLKVPRLVRKNLGKVSASKIGFEFAAIEQDLLNGDMDVVATFNAGTATVRSSILSHPVLADRLMSDKGQTVELAKGKEKEEEDDNRPFVPVSESDLYGMY